MKFNNIRILIFSFITILFCILLTGCTAQTSQEINTKVNNIVNEVEEKSMIDSFITEYNKSESVPISDCIDFVASDKNSGYYRTEFRLLAFKNAKSQHGKIGDSDIDMIDYSSNLGTIKFENFRVYISSKDSIEAKRIATTAIKILDSSITDEDIENTFNSMSTSFVLGKYLKGNIMKNEIMIDFSKN